MLQKNKALLPPIFPSELIVLPFFTHKNEDVICCVLLQSVFFYCVILRTKSLFILIFYHTNNLMTHLHFIDLL